jgi:hypothetical protein
MTESETESQSHRALPTNAEDALGKAGREVEFDRMVQETLRNNSTIVFCPTVGTKADE